MSNPKKKIYIGLLSILLLLSIIAFFSEAGPRVTGLLLMLTLAPLCLLLPVEYIIIAAVFLIPLAPHTMLFSDALPSMTVDLPVMLICGAVFLFPAFKQRYQFKGLWLLAGCWAAFAILTVISWLYAGSHNLFELFTINRFIFFIALLVITAAVNHEHFNFRRVCRSFYAAAFVVALFGLVQYLFYEIFFNEWYIKAYLKVGMESAYYNRIYDRVISTFGNPHNLGIYLGIILMVALSSNFWGFNSRWTRLVWGIVIITAIILTRSRTTFICLALGYMFILIFNKRANIIKNLLYALGSVAVILGVVIPSHNWLEKLINYSGSLQARYIRWDQAWGCFLSSPLCGVGPNPDIRDSFNLPIMPIDNIYLTVLASYGLLGMLILALTIFTIANQLIKIYPAGFMSRNIGLGLGCGLFMLLIANLSGDFLFNTKVTGPYLLLLGCFLAGARRTNSPLKILLVGNAQSIHVQRWGTALAEQGLSVHVLSPVAQAIKGCTIHEISGKATPILSLSGMLNYIKKMLQVEKKMKKIAPDLVHIHGAVPFSYFVTSYTGGPVLTSTWGSDIYQYAGKSWSKNKIVRSILNKSELVTTHNHQMNTYIRKNFGVKNSLVLSWGIDEQIFNLGTGEEKEHAKKLLNIPPSNKVVLSPRSMAPLYNIKAILESIPPVLELNKDVTYCLLRGSGSAGYEAEMIQKATALGIQDSTRWIHEFQNPEEMARLYRAADVFISIPKTDSSALTIAEGLACGSIPVLKSLQNYQCFYDSGALIHTVDNTGPKALAGAINLALRNSTRETRTKNAAAGVSLGTWREAVERMTGIYAALAAGKQGIGEKTLERKVGKLDV
ncbi:MAG: glycosyltransferase [Desulfotomaculaceae bacterium]|nr:glycosyltransferase [Desulfotomaculaceae bacterium]